MLRAITDVKTRPKPVVLLILDGWGLATGTAGNAIGPHTAPTFEYLWKHYPHAVLQSYKRVMGTHGSVVSAEVGHASIGAGRVVKDDLDELNLVMDNGQFFANSTLATAFAQARDAKKAVHLIGLASEGGIHGSVKHARSLVAFAKQVGVKDLWVHPITDGEDVPSRSALEYINELEDELRIQGVGGIATLMGRYYAMDRDKHWERTEQAYKALVHGEGPVVKSATDALQQAYRSGLSDAQVLPTIVNATSNSTYHRGRIAPGDIVIVWNFRADSIVQLIRILHDPSALRQLGVFRKVPLAKAAQVVTLTDFQLQIPNLAAAYPAAVIENTLAELLDNHGLTQLHVAESEKAGHVTYYFNGGKNTPYEHEDRIIVPSPRTDSYAKTPAMAAAAITQAVERAIRTKSHDFIVANFANVDMVVKTGNLEAASRAVATVDEALRRIANEILSIGGALIITADHGNAESIVKLTQGISRRHTVNPVPFIYVAPSVSPSPGAVQRPALNSLLVDIARSRSSLADVAPTILELFGIAKPSDMTGSSLL